MGKVLSIEIGMYSTKVCEASMGLTPKIYNCFTFDTPDNAVEDGYIRDKTALEMALRSELTKAGIKTKDVVYTVTSTKIANREVVIPPVKKEKIQQVIEANAQDYFPIDMLEYTISYSILKKVTSGEEKGWKIMVLAVPDNLIKNYYSFSESMGFRVKNIDYMGNSVFQVFKRQKAAGATLSLMLNEQTTMIYVIDNGVLSLQRTIPYGMLVVAEEVMNRPVFEAETEREAARKLGTEEILFPRLGWQGEENEGAEEAAAALEIPGEELFASRRGVTDSVDYLIGNLIRVMDFYHTRKEGKAIEQILIAGVGAKIKGIPELISNETHLKVDKVERPTGINFTKASLAEQIDFTSFISCLGALTEPIKLESKEQIVKKNRKSVLSGARVILELSAVLSLVLIGISTFQLRQEKATERQLTKAIDDMSSIRELYEESSRVEKEHDQYTEAYQLTETETEKLSELFMELEQELPKNSVVDYLSLDKEQISLTLRSPSKLSTARLMMNLREIELLSDVSLPSVTKIVDEQGKESWNYAVTARFALAKTIEDEALAEEEAENEEN